MDTYIGPFAPGDIKPIVKVGQNILVIDRESYKLYKVGYIAPVPPAENFILDVVNILGLANIGAGITSGAANTQNFLNMQDGQLGQFRFRVLDDIICEVLQPQSVARFNVQGLNTNLNSFQALRDPCDHLSEQFVLEQDVPFLRVTNPTGAAITRARVQAYGFQYVLEGFDGALADAGRSITPIAHYASMSEAVRSGELFTVVPAGGWGR